MEGLKEKISLFSEEDLWAWKMESLFSVPTAADKNMGEFPIHLSNVGNGCA